jgi:2-keto-3-deoxy-L-rhamnonate aldolase RhmA
MVDLTELWAALLTVAAGALAMVVRRFVPLGRVSGWLRRTSDVANGAADTVDAAAAELQIIASEQREAYDHLREILAVRPRRLIPV